MPTFANAYIRPLSYLYSLAIFVACAQADFSSNGKELSDSKGTADSSGAEAPASKATELPTPEFENSELKDFTVGDSQALGGDIPEDGILIDGNGMLATKDCLKIEFENSTYYICKGPKSKIDAVNFCIAQGAELAIIETEEENRWVVDTALKTHGCSNYQKTSYWIANLTSQTSATWTSGQAKWAPKEPLGDGNDIHILRYCASPYGWNDLNAGGNYTLGWICESKH